MSAKLRRSDRVVDVVRQGLHDDTDNHLKIVSGAVTGSMECLFGGVGGPAPGLDN